jgi:hypothetical protein
MALFDAGDHIKRMFRVPEIARAMSYPITREEKDGGDVWDGILLKHWTDPMKKKIIPLAYVFTSIVCIFCGFSVVIG